MTVTPSSTIRKHVNTRLRRQGLRAFTRVWYGSSAVRAPDDQSRRPKSICHCFSDDTKSRRGKCVTCRGLIELVISVCKPHSQLLRQLLQKRAAWSMHHKTLDTLKVTQTRNVARELRRAVSFVSSSVQYTSRSLVG